MSLESKLNALFHLPIININNYSKIVTLCGQLWYNNIVMSSSLLKTYRVLTQNVKYSENLFAMLYVKLCALILHPCFKTVPNNNIIIIFSFVQCLNCVLGGISRHFRGLAERLKL